MRPRIGAIANLASAEQAAEDFLSDDGSAVGAVLCGFFAAAGDHSGVLLSPVTVLVGGVGAGVRAFDGRAWQPGRGAKRPRGYRQHETIPDAARVAVPGGVAAAAVAHAYDGSQRLDAIVKAGVRRARRRRASARAALLERVGAVGAAALTESTFVQALLRVAGPSQGGLVTPADFATVPALDRKASRQAIGTGALLVPPWTTEPLQLAPGSEIGVGHAVCAVDVRGVFAALGFRRVERGVAIEELELKAPLAAAPVQRGHARVRPGSRLAAPAPVAIRCDALGAPIEVLAAPSAWCIDATVLQQLPLLLRRDPSSRRVAVVRSGSRDG
jgi:gamma-glutamyltranspeptidase/glutathione hydrolase